MSSLDLGILSSRANCGDVVTFSAPFTPVWDIFPYTNFPSRSSSLVEVVRPFP